MRAFSSDIPANYAAPRNTYKMSTARGAFQGLSRLFPLAVWTTAIHIPST
jgi:hypothetical protein